VWICTHVFGHVLWRCPLSVCCHSRFLFPRPPFPAHFPHFCPLLPISIATACGVLYFYPGKSFLWCNMYKRPDQLTATRKDQMRMADVLWAGSSSCPAGLLPPFATRPSRTNFGHNNNCGHYEAKACDAKSHTHVHWEKTDVIFVKC